MKQTELLQALRSLAKPDKYHCLRCDHRYGCVDHGCAIIWEAIREIQQLALLAMDSQGTGAVFEGRCKLMEPRLIDVNDLARYTVTIGGNRYIPWVKLADVPTAAIPLAHCRYCGAKKDERSEDAGEEG